jgi:pimeloyl-ACP methyl ester carboxylesterase
MTDTITCTADDGVQVTATNTGIGRPLVLLPGGIDYTGRGWDKVVPLLTSGHRVVRFVRRFYRPELGDPFRWTMADEARDVAALAGRIGEPIDIVGHSSGGVLALECLVRDPEFYRSAVVFEAPIILDQPLGGESLAIATKSLSAGHPGRAMTTFFRDVVGMPAWSAWLSAVALTAVPAYRARIPGQVADLAAIDALGDQRTAYRTIQNAVLGIWGTASPEHLANRMKALIDALPNAQEWRVDGGHASQQKHPQLHAERITKFLAATD